MILKLKYGQDLKLNFAQTQAQKSRRDSVRVAADHFIWRLFLLHSVVMRLLCGCCAVTVLLLYDCLLRNQTKLEFTHELSHM